MMHKGLNKEEVRKQLIAHGYNELPSEAPKHILRIAFEVMKEPMFLLLIGCGVLYILLGDYQEGIILLSTILIIIFITFYQYQKTEKALESLKKLSSPRALVIREGLETRIAGREVVPDDILILNEGDRIPADGVVIDSTHLTVDESMLTGESVAVNKSVQQNKNNSNGLVFSGTLVVQGKAFVKVTATGLNSQFGIIGKSLQQIQQDETRMQKEMKVLIRNLFIIGIVISVGVVAAFYYTRGHFIQSLLNGLASSMAILPEEFPVVLTIFLALGAWRLSKKNVLTRNPTAIETLGSATVLCTDKTGTITQNQMSVAAIHTQGEDILRADFIGKENKISEILLNAHRASQQDTIDPMEKAITSSSLSFNKNAEKYTLLLKEFPLSKSLFAMTRVLKNDTDRTYVVACKGAPEAVLKLCRVNEQESQQYLSVVQKFAAEGYRVLAVAYAYLDSDVIPERQEDFDFTFQGLIGFEDPIRPEVPQAILESKDAGIKIIMITGDYPATARSIATQIGMSTENEIMTGDQLKKLSDEELREKISGINIFARIVPEQKLRIVQALKANGEIVAMTGDGVNDAPALKAAHIGIAMGNKGTDVAREASSLVLLDDNFSSIVSAIRLGRRIYDNLQKAMSYIIAIHIPIIGLTLLPAFFPALPILLMPLHIVIMELIIDPSCSIAFEYEQEEKNIMQRLPRDPNDQFFGGKKIFYSFLQGLLLLAMTISVYFLSLDEGHSDKEVRAITFTSLIIGNVFLILSNLSKTRSFMAVLSEKNPALWTIIILAAILLFLIISVPFLQQTFSFEFPGYQHFVPSLIGASSVLILLESIKFIHNYRNRRP